MTYPDFLSPLADSYRDVNEFTTPAIAYSYDLFIETQLKKKKLTKNWRQNRVELKPQYSLGAQKEDLLLKFILEDQITVPYSLYENPVPGEKFANRFLAEIQTLWKLTTPKGGINPNLHVLTSENNPVSYIPPKIMGYDKAPEWLYYFLQGIEDDGEIEYSHHYLSKGDGTTEKVTNILYLAGDSQIFNKALSTGKITDDEVKDFSKELAAGKWSLYVEHYPLVSNQFFKTLPKAGIGTLGTGFTATATAGNILAYTITPELGILASAVTGVMLLSTGISTLVWKNRNRDVGIIRLTPAGQKLLKEYSAWNKYLNRKSDG